MLSNIIKSQRYTNKSRVVILFLICNSLFSCTNGKQLLGIKEEACQAQQSPLINTEQEHIELIEMPQSDRSSFTRLLDNSTVTADQVEEKTTCPKWLKWISGITFFSMVCATPIYYYYFQHLNINNTRLIPVEKKYLDNIKDFLGQYFPNTAESINSSTISASIHNH